MASVEYIPSTTSSSQFCPSSEGLEDMLATLQSEGKLTGFGLHYDGSPLTNSLMQRVKLCAAFLVGQQQKNTSPIELPLDGSPKVLKRIFETSYEDSLSSAFEGLCIDKTKHQKKKSSSSTPSDKVHALFCEKLHMTCLPEVMFRDEYMRVIDLSHNAIFYLSPSVRNFIRLTKLDLSFNFLISIPPEIGDLKNLEELDLRSNYLHSIPSEVSKLAKLSSLLLDDNPLNSIPQALLSIPSVYCLSLRHCGLSVVPQELGKLKNLRYLYLGDNSISQVPANFFSSLVILDLTQNCLSALPSSVQTSKTLSELYLAKNFLTTLPDLSHSVLVSLDISGNPMKGTLSLPKTLLTLWK